MRVWLCKVMVLVLLVQSLPPMAWAGPSRAAQRARLDRQVTAQVTQYPYDAWKQEIAELDQILQDEHLSTDERAFAQLEREIATLQVEHIDQLDSHDPADYAAINDLYSHRLEALRVKEKDLEQKIQLREFYQKAQSLAMVKSAVYALHQHTQDSNTRAQQAQHQAQAAENRLARQNPRAFLDRELPDLPASLPPSLQQEPVSLRVAQAPVLHTPVQHSRQNQLLTAWANHEITLEDLVEYVDPVDPATSQLAELTTSSDLLLTQLYGYNLLGDQLSPEQVENARWLAKRLRVRAQHQLHVLEQPVNSSSRDAFHYIQARGNLMRLMVQADKFLKRHPDTLDENTLVQYDSQLPAYNAVKTTLTGHTLEQWSYPIISEALAQAVMQQYQQHPSQDSADFTFLTNNIAYVSEYLIEMGKINLLSDLLAMMDNDGTTFHGYNEPFVSAAFGGIFNAMTVYPLSENAQRKVRTLVECAAAPVCHYNQTKKKNAVNVRSQALAVGSMLRQVAKTHHIPTDGIGTQPDSAEITHLSEALFEDPQWRASLAAYTVDLYGPTQQWNVGAGKNITSYGLALDELQQYSNYLSRIYDSLLPVPEPKVTIRTLTTGIYKGCWVREIDTRHLVNLNNLDKNGEAVSPHESAEGYPCNELSKNYGKNSFGFDTAIVHDSTGRVRGMKYFNPYNRQQQFRDFGSKLVLEVATWYLWGAAFKGMRHLWKGARALTLATRAAAQASGGLKLMRFNSKFSQVWKLSTNGWKTEIGMFEVAEKDGKILAEIHRPGFQHIVMTLDNSVLQGHSLKSLKGRILLRRAVQRKIYTHAKQPAAQAAVTDPSRLLSVATDDVTHDLTVATDAARNAAPKPDNGLARELARPLTQAEQTLVKDEHALVRTVGQEVVNGNIVSVPAGDLPLTLFKPITTPQPLIDLTTRLPEGLVFDPVTGNVTSAISRQYIGTMVIPSTQNHVLYNVAAGLTQYPSAQFPMRFLANRFSIIPQVQGLTKFVATMTALDQPIYYGYVKPYMQDFSQRQNQAFIQQTGYDEESAKKNPAPATLLSGMQGISTRMDNTVGATLQGAFLGANQLLNYVLPSPLQTARQWLFKQTTQAITAIDEPIAQALSMDGFKAGEFLPLPGQVLSFPLIMASDPTPQYNEATRTQYALAADKQHTQQAMTAHNISDSVDKELQALVQADTFIAENEDLLNALPTAKKELKRAYKVFEQDLKRIQRNTQNKPTEAQEQLIEARRKFIYTTADVMQRAVTAHVAQLKQAIATDVAVYQQNYSFLFTDREQEELTQLYTWYYTQYEPALIDFYTASRTALQTNRDTLLVQQNAAQRLDQLAKEFVEKRNRIDTELEARVTLANTFMEQWENDYKDMCPAQLLFMPQELQDQFNAITNRFSTQVDAALQHVTTSQALEQTYRRLVEERKQQFEAFKRYWIAQSPFYEGYLNRTLRVVEQQQQ